MIRLKNSGIEISVSEQDVDWYKRAGFVEVNEVNNEEAPDNEKALPDMTMTELKNEAKARGLSGYSALAKDELLALLTGEQNETEGD